MTFSNTISMYLYTTGCVIAIWVGRPFKPANVMYAVTSGYPDPIIRILLLVQSAKVHTGIDLAVTMHLIEAKRLQPNMQRLLRKVRIND